MLERPGAYLHFPWCVKKCPYCDFNSHPLRGDDAQAQFAAYTDALGHDIAAQLDGVLFCIELVDDPDVLISEERQVHPVADGLVHVVGNREDDRTVIDLNA